MLNKALSLINKAVPIGLGIKGLGKIDPRLEKFFTGAAAAGYGADVALDFLKGKLNGDDEDTEMLEKGNAQGNLRPDEAASLQVSRQENELPKALKTGAITGASLAGGIGGLATSALGAASQGQANVPPSAPNAGSGNNTPAQALGQNQHNALGQQVLNPPHSQPTTPPSAELQAAMKPQSPLSRSALTQQAQQMVAPDDVLQAFEQMANQLQDPVKAAGQMSTLPQYRDIIKQIEKQSGMNFLDWAVSELGKKRQPQQGQQGQGGQQQGNNSDIMGLVSQSMQLLKTLKGG